VVVGNDYRRLVLAGHPSSGLTNRSSSVVAQENVSRGTFVISVPGLRDFTRVLAAMAHFTHLALIPKTGTLSAEKLNG
jgi:hypothetical protein